MNLRHLALALTSVLALWALARRQGYSLPFGATVEPPSKLELAQTAQEKKQGLMDRNMASDQGMLFTGMKQPAMWMKNTPTALDIIFLSDHNKVLDIAQGAPGSLEPIVSRSSEAATQVLEVPKGWASSHNVQIGDLMRL